MKLKICRLIKSYLPKRWLFSFTNTSNSKTSVEKLFEELGFTLGEQFEKHEFDLEYLDSKVINGIEYCTYRYLKPEKIQPLGLRVDTVTLYYNCDILKAIQITFCTASEKKFLQIFKEIDMDKTHKKLGERYFYKLKKDEFLVLICSQKFEMTNELDF